MTDFEDKLTRIFTEEADLNPAPVFDAHRIAANATRRWSWYRKTPMTLAIGLLAMGGATTTAVFAPGGHKTEAPRPRPAMLIPVPIDPQSIGNSLDQIASRISSRATALHMKDVTVRADHAEHTILVTTDSADVDRITELRTAGGLSIRPIVPPPAGSTPQCPAPDSRTTWGPNKGFACVWKTAKSIYVGDAALFYPTPVAAKAEPIAGSAPDRWEVVVTLNAAGARRLADLTGPHQPAGHRIAVAVGDVVYDTPTITAPITDGRITIRGTDGLPRRQAEDLAVILSQDAIPGLAQGTAD